MTSASSTSKVTTTATHNVATTHKVSAATKTTKTTTTTTTTKLTTTMQVTTTVLITETESIYGISKQEGGSDDSSHGTVYICVSVVAILTLIAIVTIVCWYKRRRSHRGDNISVSCEDVQIADTAETQIYENQQTSRYVEWFEPGKQADSDITDYIYENQTVAKRHDHNKQTSAKFMNNIVEDNIYENQIDSDPVTELGNFKEQPENNYEVLQTEERLADEYLTIDNVNQSQY
ncbi:uncharacterized protein LOC128556362 isoform X1 [Mercenaria mercenaria]|uniref:uncharacterized protein LOC128556362 isoform X1 n=1 Tax=Mercenaria mercenaria TaxID=6596 RepID=UPI00234EEC3A|nr:uncharacterized protein LOC128556362 isoform X1 [Mercenaria mercenaria]